MKTCSSCHDLYDHESRWRPKRCSNKLSSACAFNLDHIADRADYSLLKLANEKGKFAISVHAAPDQSQVDALERGLEAEWFRLYDVSPIAAVPGVFRIFKLTEAGHARRDHLTYILREK